MKNKSLVLIVIGVLLVAVGGFLHLSGGPPSADPALVQACEATMADRGGDGTLTARCKEVAFATAVTATDAESAARAISAANNSEIGGGMVAMFVLGLGLALLVSGVVLRLRRTPT